MRLHRHIAEVLEQLYQAQPEPHLAELAYHFLQAAQCGGDAAKAKTYAVRAGERALALLAYEEAASHYEQALQALILTESHDERQRCELLLSLGEAHRKAGDVAQARDAFQRASELARGLRRREGVQQAGPLLARAALGFAGEWWGEYGAVDQQLVELLQEALDTLGESESAFRARVLARLAIVLYFDRDPDRRVALSQQAVEVARRVGDRATLAEALNSRHWALWGHANNVEERLTGATEMVQLAREEGISELVLTGCAWRIADFLEMGEIAAVDAEIATFTRLATDLRQPFYLWWAAVFRVMRALLDGRFTEVETLAQQAAVIGRRAPNQGAIQAAFGAQILVLSLAQGQLQKLQDRFTHAVAQFPGVPTWRSALALLYCETGREVDARREFAHLAADNFSSLPRDAN